MIDLAPYTVAVVEPAGAPRWPEDARGRSKGGLEPARCVVTLRRQIHLFQQSRPERWTVQETLILATALRCDVDLVGSSPPSASRRSPDVRSALLSRSQASAPFPGIPRRLGL